MSQINLSFGELLNGFLCLFLGSLSFPLLDELVPAFSGDDRAWLVMDHQGQNELENQKQVLHDDPDEGLVEFVPHIVLPEKIRQLVVGENQKVDVDDSGCERHDFEDFVPYSDVWDDLGRDSLFELGKREDIKLDLGEVGQKSPQRSDGKCGGKHGDVAHLDELLEKTKGK